MSTVVTRPKTRAVFSTRKPRKRKVGGLPMLERVLQATTQAVALTLLLLLLLRPLTTLWRAAMQLMIERLSLDANVVGSKLQIGPALLATRLHIDMAVPPADWSALTLHALFAGGIFGLTWAVRSMPLRCGLRILCGLHVLGLVMTALHTGTPSAYAGAYPNDIARHTGTLFDSALIWLMLTPSLLATGFFLVERSWINRLVASALILGFAVVALPLKLVLHSVLVSMFTPAVIPVLFLAGGPVLDILMLGALYAWVLTWPQLRLRRR